MKRVQHGFTIIEVMLFLGVSGVLAAGILATAGSTIGAQRYRDAVDSFSQYIQGQYGQTVSVRNDLDNHDACTGAGFSASSQMPAGTSADCAIIGRLATTSNGQDFVSVPVYMSGVDNKFLQTSVGIGDDTIFNATGDRRVFVRADGSGLMNTESYTLDWGTKTQAPASGQNAWSIAVVRSPVSGTIHTYTSRAFTNSNGSLQTLIQDNNRKNDTHICVDPEGWLVGQRLSVNILADAPGASSVTTGTSVEGAC